MSLAGGAPSACCERAQARWRRARPRACVVP